MQKLEDYLRNTDDEVLLKVEDELTTGIVPSTGYAHSMIRTINKLIDAGSMCINTTMYRKVYLPTFAKAVHKELAERYCKLFKYQGGHYVKGNNNYNI